MPRCARLMPTRRVPNFRSSSVYLDLGWWSVCTSRTGARGSIVIRIVIIIIILFGQSAARLVKKKAQRNKNPDSEPNSIAMAPIDKDAARPLFAISPSYLVWLHLLLYVLAPASDWSITEPFRQNTGRNSARASPTSRFSGDQMSATSAIEISKFDAILLLAINAHNRLESKSSTEWCNASLAHDRITTDPTIVESALDH